MIFLVIEVEVVRNMKARRVVGILAIVKLLLIKYCYIGKNIRRYKTRNEVTTIKL